MPSEPKIKKAIKSKLLLRPSVDSDPRLLGSRKKGIVLICLALCACTAGLSSTIYFPGLPNITSDLHAPPIATTLTAALFALAMGIAPMFWASLSDFYQVRRVLFLFSMIIFAAASIGCAFINNIWGLVVLRCVQSCGSSCGQSVGAGVIADCYPTEKRGTAFDSKFDLELPVSQASNVSALSSSTGSITIPQDTDDKTGSGLNKTGIEGSTVIQHEKKNAPETSGPKEAKKSINPIAPFLLLRHPFILIASLASGIAFGSMFAVETIIPDLYETHYGFTSWKTGLSYLSGGIGNLLSAIVSAKTSDRLLLRARERRGGKEVVEDRLSITLWPSFFFFMPFGILLYGWTIERNFVVWAPIIGFGCLNFGMNLIMTSTSAYLVDGLSGQGASVTAAANFVRMVIACILSIAANPMVTSIGPGYTSVFLTCLCFLGALLLLLLKLQGEKMRHWSGY
ncbi:hypothetical protein G6F57_013279 [Rhizopus arrhizus]|uniref:Major facilitator superfamily (MFS) profile domain-containing protein n=1 Tax=Rhizopus oryzae TaxID=64495 RepID=A0A9P6WY02_RHIOR|nr:hypothetical protein G6F24_012467 [Rhizopus arrhizus]KAG1398940.1 hypothetical protein G6F58_011225 [Rhizopus delemar]KAG0779513.1 hypothetical protein G6F22_010593 [Rhizopus arrhizus]KAG0780483.1 hypothetical protein G6F21_012112 [Rhizopus arrhizus]KAG0804974.1 hypothetical protein G6F20_012275 [Rhizopus arrhizus]